MFGRVRTTENRSPIGSGWWLTASATSWPNRPHRRPQLRPAPAGRGHVAKPQARRTSRERSCRWSGARGCASRCSSLHVLAPGGAENADYARRLCRDSVVLCAGRSAGALKLATARRAGATHCLESERPWDRRARLADPSGLGAAAASSSATAPRPCRMDRQGLPLIRDGEQPAQSEAATPAGKPSESERGRRHQNCARLLLSTPSRRVARVAVASPTCHQQRGSDDHAAPGQ